jgi:hypothetical protein
MNIPAIVLLVLLLSGVSGCSARKDPQAEIPTPQNEFLDECADEEVPPSDLRVQAGVEPLWMEFGGDGLSPISSPQEAALVPFTPWPLAVHAAGIVSWAEGLAIPVNRVGLWLVKEAGDGLFDLYFLPETEILPLYTMLGAFVFQDKPSFLIYRDDFFMNQEVPPPESKFFTITDDVSGLKTVEIPAFSGFPGAEGWDIEGFFTHDALWYFKAVKKATGIEDVRYVRTESLSVGGNEVSLDVYMTAARKVALPEPAAPDDAPPQDIFSGLPPLPENFVYTAHARTGSTRIAVWEEQENWNIGASGILFLVEEITNEQ